MLEGEVTENCETYEIIAGGSPFALAGGESLLVTVRSTPTESGDYACTISTGLYCADVDPIGTALLPPPCAIDTLELDFGVVEVGHHKDLSFAITNVGGGTLTGMVSEARGEFGLVSGGGSYSLGAGASRVVVVRYEPVDDGIDTCSIDTGTPCENVSCIGIGQGCQGCCIVIPTYLDFGTVPPGGSAERSFIIINNHGGAVTGTVTESCHDYSIVSGSGAFNIVSGATVLVVVKFEPTSPGVYDCTINTGTECADVAVHGVCRSSQQRIYVDIKPGSCPNTLRLRHSLCLLPAAILGTESFDVTSILPSTVRMHRDGVPDSVAPRR